MSPIASGKGKESGTARVLGSGTSGMTCLSANFEHFLTRKHENCRRRRAAGFPSSRYHCEAVDEQQEQGVHVASFQHAIQPACLQLPSEHFPHRLRQPTSRIFSSVSMLVHHSAGEWSRYSLDLVTLPGTRLHSGYTNLAGNRTLMISSLHDIRQASRILLERGKGR